GRIRGCELSTMVYFFSAAAPARLPLLPRSGGLDETRNPSYSGVVALRISHLFSYNYCTNFPAPDARGCKLTWRYLRTRHRPRPIRTSICPDTRFAGD